MSMSAMDAIKERMGRLGYDAGEYAPCDSQDEKPIECRDAPDGDEGGDDGLRVDR